MRGIVDKDVDAAKIRNGLIDDRATVFWILDVPRNKDGLASGLLHEFCRVFSVFFFLKIRDEDVGAFAGIGNRHGATDATIPAGDHRTLALEPTGALVPLLPMVGARLHRLRITGRFLLLFRVRGLRVLGHGSILSLSRDQHRRASEVPGPGREVLPCPRFARR